MRTWQIRTAALEPQLFHRFLVTSKNPAVLIWNFPGLLDGSMRQGRWKPESIRLG